ncbi:hypothetical protein [Methylobacterium sp. W2]|uniref:hypothetical protein n=1 Tax=Methylobacterium sp. W2 TaxID=2598107 RepID=UPI001D0C6A35|nr:hypothetical protein [Methylobacterium sp. W2]
MSNSMASAPATHPDLIRIAATEAQGAHIDTGQILKLLMEGGEEADPIGAIIDSQDRGAERLELIIRMLMELQGDVSQLRANSDVMMTDIQTLRTQLNVVYGKLANATLRPASSAGSPQ